MCRGFLTLNAYKLNSSYQIWVRYIFVYKKSLKQMFHTVFWVEIHLLNLYYRCKMFVLKLSGIQYIFLNQIRFCIPEIFKTKALNRFLGTKSPFEFVSLKMALFLFSNYLNFVSLIQNILFQVQHAWVNAKIFLSHTIYFLTYNYRVFIMTFANFLK